MTKDTKGQYAPKAKETGFARRIRVAAKTCPYVGLAALVWAIMTVK